MNPSLVEIAASGLFAAAVLHTFLVGHFEALASRHPEGSITENFFHFLGEVEVVFGLWAGVLLLTMIALIGPADAVSYAESLNFTEPLFVFAIMAVAATRPIIEFARKLILFAATVLPLHRETAIFVSCLVIGPLLGSLITEPAAMTVTALVLKDRYFVPSTSLRFKYVALATLFVSISIGGVLTPFAAPPVLMVAAKWNWDFGYMLSNFGWRSVLATLLNATLAAWICRKELRGLATDDALARIPDHGETPAWLTALHLAFLGLIVLTAHHPVIFIGLLLFFLGIAAITKEFQDEIKLRESLLVAFFLGGLVVLGGLQGWWLSPLIRNLDGLPLFVGATALTAITDNAALTYLGSQVEGVGEAFKLALVSGAVAGGGLTVIANAPNPAGYAILRDGFGRDGIRPRRLLIAALIPTAVAMLCLGLGR